MNGARSVAAGLDATRTRINDPAALKECIQVRAGRSDVAERMPRDNDVKNRIVERPSSAGESLSDIEPPNLYKLAFEDYGGAAGFANSSAHTGLVAKGITIACTMWSRRRSEASWPTSNHA